MLHTHEVTGSSPVVSTRYYIEDLCNGSTPDSDSVCGGSNPSSSAMKVFPGNGSITRKFPIYKQIEKICLKDQVTMNSAQLGYLYISKLFGRVGLPRSASFFRKLVLCSSSFQCTPWLPAGSIKTNLRNAVRIALTTKLAGNLTPKRSLCAMQIVQNLQKSI